MKLSLKTKVPDSGTTESAAPTPTTSTAGGSLKIKFKTSTNAGSPPAASPPPPTPTIKLKPSKAPKTAATSSKTKKRPRDADDLETGTTLKKQATTATIRLSQNNSALIGKSAVINIKPSAASTPTTAGPSQTRLKIKAKGKIPPRPQGVGYDSDAQDAEADPAIEEHFVLRMLPGADCEYLRNAIEERKIGVPVRDGGADVGLRFFRSDGRRAAINIRGTFYAAALVDLPCIVETMKSWDKRGWWKSADICQMLLVYRRVSNEDDARHCALPPEVNERTWQWPHGLTPPMHNVRKRRFRKRVSHRTIEAAEAEVERLLAMDQKCREMRGVTKYEVVDLEMEGEEDDEVEYDDEEDAEGEPDEENLGDNDDLLASMMQQLEEDDVVAELPSGAVVGDTTVASNAPTPTVSAELLQVVEDVTSPSQNERGVTDGEGEGEGDEGDDADEDEDSGSDDDDAEESEEDEDARSRAQEKAQQQEEVEYLEKELAMQREAYTKQTNPLLKNRMKDKIKGLEADLQIKKRALGVTDDDA